jgi:hypothetical protein
MYWDAGTQHSFSFKTTRPRRSHGLRGMVLRALETALRGLRSLARHCVDPVKLDGIALPTCARSIFRSSQSGTRRPRGRKRHRGLSALTLDILLQDATRPRSTENIVTTVASHCADRCLRTQTWCEFSESFCALWAQSVGQRRSFINLLSSPFSPTPDWARRKTAQIKAIRMKSLPVR